MIEASGGVFPAMMCRGIAVNGQRMRSTESYLTQRCSPELCGARDLILGEIEARGREGLCLMGGQFFEV
jgi:hypothetical protein